jgi:hypothetical protein
MARADQAGEDDTAVTAEDHKESALAYPRANRTAERTAVREDRGFVARSTWGTIEVLVERRDHVTPVPCAEPLHEASRSKRRRRLVHVLGLARLMIGAEPDVRGSANDTNVRSHSRMVASAATNRNPSMRSGRRSGDPACAFRQKRATARRLGS